MRSLTNKWVILNRQGEVQRASSRDVYFDTEVGAHRAFHYDLKHHAWYPYYGRDWEDSLNKGQGKWDKNAKTFTIKVDGELMVFDSAKAAGEHMLAIGMYRIVEAKCLIIGT